MRKKGKILYVTDRDNDNEVYLIRYPLFNNRFFGLYIHRFLKSDKEDPHDHPFDFIGYVVKGQYYEQRYQIVNPESIASRAIVESGSAYRYEGSIAFRKAPDAHVVKLDEEINDLSRYQEAPLTVILRGPRYRKWGFWVTRDLHGADVAVWQHWQDYRPDGTYKTPDTLAR